MEEIYKVMDRHTPMDPRIRNYMGIILKSAHNLIELRKRGELLTDKDILFIKYYEKRLYSYRARLYKEYPHKKSPPLLA